MASIKGGGQANLQNAAQYHLADLGNNGVYVVNSSNTFYTDDISDSVFNVASATVSGTTMTVTLSGTPDISKVVEGNIFVANGLTYLKDGSYPIVTITSGSYLFTIVVPAGTTSQAGAGGTAQFLPWTGAYAIKPINGDATVQVVERNTFGLATPTNITILDGDVLLGDFAQVACGTGTARCYLK